MTNEQMIRELRAVAEKYKGRHVFTCETNINLMATDAANRIESLCDEISRQKEEIERLENSLAISKKETKRYVARCQTIRSDVAKEFADRLKKRETTAISCKRFEGVISTDDIDNLVKEFTEEKT